MTPPNRYETVEEELMETVGARKAYGVRFPVASYLEQCACKLSNRGLLVLRYGAFILIVAGPNAAKHLDEVFQPRELFEGWEDGAGLTVQNGLLACIEAVIMRAKANVPAPPEAKGHNQAPKVADPLALKPCPFCGESVAEIRSNGIGDFYVICYSDEDKDGRLAGRFGLGCGARTSDASCESKEQAVSRWNERAK